MKKRKWIWLFDMKYFESICDKCDWDKLNILELNFPFIKKSFTHAVYEIWFSRD